MAEVNVLIVFYSRYGNTEKLALAAGVGAIQAKANIRLRRVADAADQQTIASNPAWKQHLDRMNMDYVVPRPADPLWADVIVLATPAEGSPELEAYVSALPLIGLLTGKIAAPLASGHSESALKPLYLAAACAGLIVAPAGAPAGDEVAAARTYGQRVSEMALALKSGR